MFLFNMYYLWTVYLYTKLNKLSKNHEFLAYLEILSDLVALFLEFVHFHDWLEDEFSVLDTPLFWFEPLLILHSLYDSWFWLDPLKEKVKFINKISRNFQSF